MDLSVVVLVFALGLRHGLDPDHLAAVDGLTRLRPNPWNGVLFALGHGGVVTVLALVTERVLGTLDSGWLAPWLFLALAGVNLIRLLKPHQHAHRETRWLKFGPLMLGVLLAVGFETASQLSALALSNRIGPLWLGVAFTLGMLATDGVDGWLASRLQHANSARAAIASRAMGWVVVLVSVLIAVLELLHLDLGAIALPLGLALFGGLVGLRLWSLRLPTLS